ncbi:MAG: hypothetical protein AAGH79_15295, partial [Bacteroidota bacterium]
IYLVMKSLVPILCLLFLGIQLFGQKTEPSSTKWVLGGSFQLSFQNNSSLNIPGLPPFGSYILLGSGTNPVRDISVGIFPYLGRQFNDRILIGVNIYYQGRFFKLEDALLPSIPDPAILTRVSQQGGLVIFSRWTFNPQNKVQIFVEPNLGYNVQSAEVANDGIPTSQEITQYGSLSASLGAAYSLSERWRLLVRSGSASLLVGQWRLKNSLDQNNFTLFNANLSLSSIRFGAELVF